MKNKILAVFFLLSFSSCGIFVYTNAPLASNNVIEETKEVDTTTKFIGKYDITVFDVPDVGVIELVMNVSNDGDQLKTEIEEGEELTLNYIINKLDNPLWEFEYEVSQ